MWCNGSTQVFGTCRSGSNPDMVTLNLLYMKNLYDYIESQIHYNLPRYSGFCTFEEYCDINGFVEDNLTDEQIDFYYKNVFSNGIGERSHDGYESNILEMLYSHSSDELIRNLKNILPEDYVVKKYNALQIKSNIVIISVPLSNDLVSKLNYQSNKIKTNTKLGKKLIELMHYYNYYVTDIQLFESHGTFEIYLEAVKSHNVSIDVLESGNTVYHVTSKKNLDVILKRGLRPIVGRSKMENGYRYFPERLFFIKHSENFKSDIADILTTKEFKRGEYVIFKIKLKHHEIGFYADAAANNKNAVYTVKCIPPQLLKDYVFDINEL